MLLTVLAVGLHSFCIRIDAYKHAPLLHMPIAQLEPVKPVKAHVSTAQVKPDVYLAIQIISSISAVSMDRIAPSLHFLMILTKTVLVVLLHATYVLI